MLFTEIVALIESTKRRVVENVSAIVSEEKKKFPAWNISDEHDYIAKLVEDVRKHGLCIQSDDVFKQMEGTTGHIVDPDIAATDFNAAPTDKVTLTSTSSVYDSTQDGVTMKTNRTPIKSATPKNIKL